MARLKRDHSGYHSYGLYAKYKEPSIIEKPAANRLKKKNTNKWCRGKVGVFHEWHSYQGKRYNWEEDKYTSPYVVIRCIDCRKEKYIKTAKSRDYPFHIWIDEKSESYQPVQVKVNGKAVPIKEYQWHKNEYWCYECRTRH